MTWWAAFREWFRPAPIRYPSQVGPVVTFIPLFLVSLHNAERAKHAVHPMLMDSRLNVEAQARATHAAAVNLTIDHVHDGHTHHENAAMGQADAGSVMDSWMNSAKHRENILDPDFARMGCGRAISAGGVTYWYCVFAG